MAEDYITCELVRSHAFRAAERRADIARQGILEHYEWSCSKHKWNVQSPIEAVFYYWWFALSDHMRSQHSGYWWALKWQEKVNVAGRNYRLDFEAWHLDWELLWNLRDAGVKVPRIAIELDGHEFHERTKAQVELRNERDRNLQQAGWIVLHFAGSEVVRDPETAVLQAFEACRNVYRIAEQPENVKLAKLQAAIDAT
jgi:hypothetical protein